MCDTAPSPRRLRIDPMWLFSSIQSCAWRYRSASSTARERVSSSAERNAHGFMSRCTFATVARSGRARLDSRASAAGSSAATSGAYSSIPRVGRNSPKRSWFTSRPAGDGRTRSSYARNTFGVWRLRSSCGRNSAPEPTMPSSTSPVHGEPQVAGSARDTRAREARSNAGARAARPAWTSSLSRKPHISSSVR
eukprot:Amastigsp_a514962_52.p3 type:complete len:193 gc:universal Amastigsp_a514962_52:782-1360(+)